MDPVLYNILVGMAAAAIYAIVFYVKNNVTDPENFDWTKFLATVVVGGVLGLINVVFLGIEVTELGIAGQLALYAGVVAVVENLLKAIKRYFFPEPTPPPA